MQRTSIALGRLYLLSQRRFSSVRRPRVAVVGSGPAGMFTCAGLLRKSDVAVDVFDASPVPFGLVRYGVAPDHQEVKNCINVFDKMFEMNRDRLSLFCNVRIGADVKFEELVKSYDGILLAYGAHRPRKLQIPGSDAKNVISGSDFVSWYNGVPKAMAPSLDTENVVIVGNGNVALDCARIISNGTNHGLRSTDIPGECLDALEKSKAKNIKIIGRRGPLDVSFTVKELREQFKVPNWGTVVEMTDEQLAEINAELPNMPRKKSRLVKVLVDGVKAADAEKQCRFLFNRVPQSVVKDADNRVSAVKVLNKNTGVVEELPCGLLIYSIGYEVIVLDGVPKNEKGMIDMVDSCRVRMPSDDGAEVFAVGWCAHGPKGVIVDTTQQAAVVSEEMSGDLTQKNGRAEGVKNLLLDRKVPFINWDQWKKIDRDEQDRGHERGKVREKVREFEKYIPR